MNTTTASITFDPDTSTYVVCRYWGSDEPIAETVVRAVAIVTNTPPADFDPLFETIDSDVLNRLFNGPSGDASRDASWVSFRFNDCVVRVYATGTIEITPAEDATPSTASVPRSLRDQ